MAMKTAHIKETRGNFPSGEEQISQTAEFSPVHNDAIYRTIARNFPNGGIYVLDREGKILVAEGKALPFVIEERDKSGRKTLSDLDIPDRHMFFPQDQPASGNQAQEFEMVYGERTLLCQCVPLFDHNSGSAAMNMVIVHNITERKKWENQLQRLSAELKRSNADLQQFASVASHDLQAPLKNIEGFLNLFVRKFHDKLDTKSSELLEYILSGVKDMEVLIRDLLEYSKAGSGNNTFTRIKTSICLARALANLQAPIEEKNAEISYDDSSFPEISGDASQMASLFQNLIGNALKFCRERPKISISAKREGSEYTFSVADNGIGMEASDAERVFAPFQRLHAKSDYPGSGVGLAICKRIVERHGGKIWVDSEPDRGSTFYFTIGTEG